MGRPSRAILKKKAPSTIPGRPPPCSNRAGNVTHITRAPVRPAMRAALSSEAAPNALPPNIRVIEFFFLAGRWLHVPFAQQHYISANYTHASSYLLARGLNVVLRAAMTAA